MRHFLVTAPVRRGSVGAVRAILREGAPYELAKTTLECHRVFLAGDELVFLFEGPHAEQEARRLLAQPAVASQISRLGRHLAGRPRLPEEVFGWSRPESPPGVDFGAFPGPGDSEGGLGD